MAVISTEIETLLPDPRCADGQLDFLLSPDSVSRVPAPAGTEFESKTKLVQDVGSRLHDYEKANLKLHAELEDAAIEKQKLVESLRELHGQFYALQSHAEEQRDALLSGGEELQACRQRIATLQKELAVMRANYERARKQQAVAQAPADTGKYDYVVASYRDALRDMKRKLACQQAAFAKQKEAQVELLRKLQTLEQQAEAFEGRKDRTADVEAELRNCLADRERQIAQLNKYIVRLQRELKFLNDGLQQKDTVAKAAAPKQADNANDFVSTAVLGQKQQQSQGASGRERKAAGGGKSNGKNGQSPGEAIPVQSAVAETQGDSEPKESQQFLIVPVSDEIEGVQFPLDKEILTVGRSPENDIHIRAKSISRFHARIIVGKSAITIEDLGSTNGVHFNSKLVKQHKLRHGDRFNIGRVEFKLIDLAIQANGLRT